MMRSLPRTLSIGRSSYRRTIAALCCFLFFISLFSYGAEVPTLILHHGKIVTVDSQFSIHQAIAIKDDRILALGKNETVLKTRGKTTAVYDLKGKMVLPGLIDSHVHPAAAMTEFDHPIPDMETIGQVLDYIRERARVLPEGDWIQLRQIFITRLREQRYPTLQELDAAAPAHPVIFSTGPDAVLNTLALRASAIDKHFEVKDGGPGYVEKDPKTGEVTGILRGLGRFIQPKTSGRKAEEADIYQRTIQLFKDYNSIGLTTVADRNASLDSLPRYEKMKKNGDLPVRLFISHSLSTLGPLKEIEENIQRIANHPLRKTDSSLQIIGVKTFLDGGMLTGSAYLREPWGVSTIYGINDPAYRGVLNIPADRLYALVRKTAEQGLQFTAHSVGDGAVHQLLEAYEKVAKDFPIAKTRPSFTHCNFMSADAIARIARLGGVIDIQPAWLYLDTRTLEKQFGYDRLRYFQPLKSLFAAGIKVGGGSDHMQKIGSMRSINPYNPFLGMWVTVTRKAKWHPTSLHPEEALSREQAIRFYTANNAYLLFKENEIGSLEPGKYADLIVLDRNLLTCSENEMSQTKVLRTYLGGKLIFSTDRGL